MDPGIKNFRWHDLRHTFGSRLAQSGVPILAIKELMGHSQITVTMRYAHLAPSNLQTAVMALDQVPAESADPAIQKKPGKIHQLPSEVLRKASQK